MLGAKALRTTDPGGVLLADAGFDSDRVFREAKGKFVPIIRLKRGGKIGDRERKEVWEAFRLETYRLRAVGERVFGRLKTRLNGKLRNLLPLAAETEPYLLAISYVLRVYVTLLVFLVDCKV